MVKKDIESESRINAFSLTGPVNWFGHRNKATHVAGLGEEQPAIAHPFPGVQLVWIQSFLSPKSVAILRLKNAVCTTIYL